MRPDRLTHSLPFDQALDRLMSHVGRIERMETVPVPEAVKRVAARHVIAQIDVPPFDRSAMDGYAVRSADLSAASEGQPVRLRCVGEALAGHLFSDTVQPSSCVEIATGAKVPPGADAVVMVEHTSRDGEHVIFSKPAPPGQHIGRRGGDIKSGDRTISEGDLVTPARMGALSAVGATSVDVFAQPTVAIISTGSEIAPAGSPARETEIHDVNVTTLGAVVQTHGGVAYPYRPVPDDMDALEQALRSAAGQHDMVVVSGGSSVGRRDLLTDAVGRCGRVLFHGIAVKPGKPTLFGLVGDTPLFGMPGNPTSCLSNAYLLLVPFLRAAARLPAWRPERVSVPLAAPIKSTADRHQFYTVRVEGGRAVPAFKSSGDITSMAHADGYIEIPAGTAGVDEGATVTVTLF